jgi:rubredoxin
MRATSRAIALDVCENCGYIFYKELMKLVSNNSEINLKTFKCPKCDERYEFKLDYFRTWKVETNIRVKIS